MCRPCIPVREAKLFPWQVHARTHLLEHVRVGAGDNSRARMLALAGSAGAVRRVLPGRCGPSAGPSAGVGRVAGRPEGTRKHCMLHGIGKLPNLNCVVKLANLCAEYCDVKLTPPFVCERPVPALEPHSFHRVWCCLAPHTSLRCGAPSILSS
jgi:hypothetical protein